MKSYKLAKLDQHALVRTLDHAFKGLMRAWTKEKPAQAAAHRAEIMGEIAERVAKIAAAGDMAATCAKGVETAMAGAERHSSRARRQADDAHDFSASAADRAHVAAICESLDAIESHRAACADLRDEADDHVGAIHRHTEAVRTHAAALGAHIEAERGLEAREHKRERLIKIASKSEAAQLPRPPDSFRVVDVERQVEAIIASSADCASGRRVLVEGVDLKLYERARAVLWGHDANRIVAYCLSIRRDGEHLVAVAQFPPAGVSYTADAAFKAIARGELRGASVSIAIDDERTAADGSREITAGRLCEWSFVSRGADPFARVISIGGKAIRRSSPSKGPAWADRANPRPPTWESAGGSSAGMAYAQAIYEQRRLAARWFMN